VGIATLTHHIEDILLAFSNKEQLPGTVISEVLMRAADTLEVMSESLLGMGPPPQDALAVLQQILNLANQIDNEGIPEADSLINLNQIDESETRQEMALNEAPEPTQQEEIENILRVPASLIDELLRLSGESVIVNSQLQERLRHTLQQNNIIQQQNSLLQNLTFELEQLVEVQGFASQEAGLANADFDSLEMDQYNELHTVTRRLVEATTDTQEMSFSIENELNSFDTLLVAQSRQNKANQNVVMQTRMVFVKSIVPRLNRSVRQTARLTDKNVNLIIHGEETLVDSEVLNNLMDPLMHVLRNAVDHGLEQEADRIKSGKDKIGKIELSFKREGDQFIVICNDDGAGLNYQAIRNKAIEDKLIEPDQATTDEELQRLILKQGFTTSDTVTQVSGRGIGMDAVYSKVLAMKGMLNISSFSGQGCTIELRLPVTFISEHALLIKVHGQQLAISSRGIEQILYPGAGQILENEDGLTFQYKDESIEASYLDVILSMGHLQNERLLQTSPTLLVRQDSGELRAIVIDEVATSQELVIKPLGDYVPQVNGIDGATILGDGSVAAVIDLPELLRDADDNLQDITVINIEPEVKESRLCALVVDDSLSARRSLAEFVMDSGYEVITARDGLDAIEVLSERTPDILLVDLEMPRMNGLELSQHIRAHSTTQRVNF
jgi:chemosensory pili system protein ChpA (sensor histidine kinase/response regulator)